MWRPPSNSEADSRVLNGKSSSQSSQVQNKARACNGQQIPRELFRSKAKVHDGTIEEAPQV